MPPRASHFTVDQAPAITSPAATAFAVGIASTFTVTTTGYPVSALSETGALPSGVNFVDNGDGTATLAGTPDVGTEGTYPLTIAAANGVIPDATQNFTLTVAAPQAPAITSADNTTFAAGTLGAFIVTTTGVPTPALSETGSLPSGVTFVDNVDGTATLAGTPGAGDWRHLRPDHHRRQRRPTRRHSKLRTHRRPGARDHRRRQPTFATGTLGTFTVTTTGFPTAALSETGSLPGGVTSWITATALQLSPELPTRELAAPTP